MFNSRYLLILLLTFGMASAQADKIAINTVLDNWHKAAAEANFTAYFEPMTSSAHYIGTDANENWDITAFKAFAKPYFDKGKAWSFTALQRNIYFSADKKMAWFDELLSTQMKICRGSGVMVKIKGAWKIEHYVLSMTVPNENTAEVVQIKSAIEDATIKDLIQK